MQNFRILMIPSDPEGLMHEFDYNCRDVDAAKDYAAFQLGMSGSIYKEARVLSAWKSSASYRQAIDPIVNNYNL